MTTPAGTASAPRYASPVDYYARDLYQRPAFRDTTDFTAFGGLVRGPRPTFLNDGSWRIKVEPRLADWDEPPGRERLG